MKNTIILFLFSLNNLIASESKSTELIGVKESLKLEQYIDNCTSIINKIENERKLTYRLSANDKDYRDLSESIRKKINQINDHETLFIMYVVIFESWAEGDIGFESNKGRLMFSAADAILVRLAQLGTQDAYYTFRKLKKIYGNDAGGSLFFNDLELEYFKEFSKK